MDTPSPVGQRTAQLALRKDGRIAALSSDGEKIYTVTLDPLSCTCPGFVGHGHCYHSEQARDRYGAAVPVCYWCDGSDGVQAFWNWWDFDPWRDPEPPTIALCKPCRESVGLCTVDAEPDACALHPAGCPSWEVA